MGTLKDRFAKERVVDLFQQAFDLKERNDKLVDIWMHYRWSIVFGFALLIIYVANGYSMETLLKEQGRVEKRVEVMRLKSVVVNAELMLMQRASSVSENIARDGGGLRQSSEPPYKLYK
ncbi:MAG: hypothetical protein J6K74_06755 [Marinifilaceae bacterium]|nr:hypothetical protein [Marinifilaceae bacterium]